jgi:hypothetical protein
MPTARLARAVHKHFILATVAGLAAAVDDAIAMPPEAAPADVVVAIPPPLASQFVNCGAMARTNPAMTMMIARTLTCPSY